MLKRYLLIIYILLILSSIFTQNLTVTYRGPESEDDKRMEYPIAILHRALELTQDKYDSFKLVPSIRMNSKRATNPDFVKNIPNYVVEASVNEYMEENFLSIKIPTTKGLFGYRVFLIDEKNSSIFKNISNIDGLRRIKLGQGASWSDVKILESAGLEVVTGTSYVGLLNMLMAGRFLAFPRGINEAFKEQINFSDRFPGLIVEDSICLYYPLPKFFYVNKENTLLHERLKIGMELMIKNGDFDKIWESHHLEYITESQLENRVIIEIDNSEIPSTVPFNVKSYWFHP